MNINKYNNNMQKIINLFKQESTWRGIIGIFTALGITISPELSVHIIAVGLALIGTINIVKPD